VRVSERERRRGREGDTKGERESEGESKRNRKREGKELARKFEEARYFARARKRHLFVVVIVAAVVVARGAPEWLKEGKKTGIDPIRRRRCRLSDVAVVVSE